VVKYLLSKQTTHNSVHEQVLKFLFKNHCLYYGCLKFHINGFEHSMSLI